MTEVSVAWELDCQLGEGPAWFAREQVLRFVDIKTGRIFTLDPAAGVKSAIEVGGQPSFIAPERDGGILVGSNLSIYQLTDGLPGDIVLHVPDAANNRTNDATVDAQGRLWFGTMDDNHTQISGAVWCLDHGNLHRAGGEAAITNGPAISPDGKWLYHVDTRQRLIWRFAFDGAPHLSDGEVFVQIEDGKGVPDGVVVDSEGCLWVGLFAGWGIRRYDPSGKLIRHIAMPCAHITKIAFGGSNLDVAFATTARIGLRADQLQEQPLAGSLFCFDPGVKGQELPSVLLV